MAIDDDDTVWQDGMQIIDNPPSPRPKPAPGRHCADWNKTLIPRRRPSLPKAN
jgi:hypothetical protein